MSRQTLCHPAFKFSEEKSCELCCSCFNTVICDKSVRIHLFLRLGSVAHLLVVTNVTGACIQDFRSTAVSYCACYAAFFLAKNTYKNSGNALVSSHPLASL